MAGKGLYANIHAKRKRGGKMRKKGAKGAPKASDFARAKQPARKGMKKGGFPALSGDGKLTKKDILMGRGVISKTKKKMKRGGSVSQMAQKASRMNAKKLQSSLKKVKQLMKKKMKRGGRAK